MVRVAVCHPSFRNKLSKMPKVFCKELILALSRLHGLLLTFRRRMMQDIITTLVPNHPESIYQLTVKGERRNFESLKVFVGLKSGKRAYYFKYQYLYHHPQRHSQEATCSETDEWCLLRSAFSWASSSWKHHTSYDQAHAVWLSKTLESLEIYIAPGTRGAQQPYSSVKPGTSM